jgi:hypothetical protein
MDITKMVAADAVAAATALPTDASNAKLRDAATEYATKQLRVEKLQKETSDLNKEIYQLRSKTIPDLMVELKTDNFGLPDFGFDLIKEDTTKANIVASWPEEQREASFTYLEQLGAGDLIKTFVEIQFGKGELEIARAVVEAVQKVLKKHKLVGRDVVESKGVPWNTLTAYVKEQLEKGTVLDLEKLGAKVETVATLKKRKD